MIRGSVIRREVNSVMRSNDSCLAASFMVLRSGGIGCVRDEEGRGAAPFGRALQPPVSGALEPFGPSAAYAGFSLGSTDHKEG